MFEDVDQDAIFEDHCGHGSKEYLGALDYPERKPELHFIRLELYIYEDTLGQELCCRYGNEPHEYLSPGSIMEVLICDIKTAKRRAIIDFLKAKGRVTWKQKEK